MKWLRLPQKQKVLASGQLLKSPHMMLWLFLPKIGNTDSPLAKDLSDHLIPSYLGNNKLKYFLIIFSFFLKAKNSVI